MCSRDCTGDCDGNRRRLGHRVPGCDHFREDCFSIEEAIAHINKYNTGHSESIITKDYSNALKFQDEIDAAAVYVNASTRFTDGFEFGFGAEIGISTQKLHARGPMGLEALTTTKYVNFWRWTDSPVKVEGNT